MYEIVQNAHSGWAYVVLGLLFIAAINALSGRFGNREFKKTDRLISLAALIAVHIQLLIALVLYFVSPLGKDALGEMKNADLRLTSLEHPLLNIIGIILITVGWSRHKKMIESGQKFQAIALFYAIGLSLILIRIPWNQW